MIGKNFRFIDKFVGNCIGKRVSEVEVKYSYGRFIYIAFYTNHNNEIAKFSRKEEISDREREVIKPFSEVCRRAGYLRRVIDKCPDVATFEYEKNVAEISMHILVAPLKGTKNLPLERMVK